MSGPSRTPPKDTEKERLAKALRDNLKRRKTQARERASESATKGPNHVSAPEMGHKDSLSGKN